MTVTRMCVGCRTRETADKLIRVVCVERQVIPDPHRTTKGRGAHVHRDLECVQLAIAKRALSRAFRVPGSVEVSALTDYIQFEEFRH